MLRVPLAEGYVGVPLGVALKDEEVLDAHVHLHGGPAPVRRFLPKLIELVLNEKISPGNVFDLSLPLEEVAAGYQRDGRAPRDQDAATAIGSVLWQHANPRAQSAFKPPAGGHDPKLSGSTLETYLAAIRAAARAPLSRRAQPACVLARVCLQPA